MPKSVINITAKCPIRTTAEMLSGKWKLLILHQLFDCPLRLSALKKIIPDISEKMLIQELKTLCDSHLVFRKNFGEVPPRVEYQLTAIGYKVMPIIIDMRNFAMAYEKALKKIK